jgi:hypothetical protein
LGAAMLSMFILVPARCRFFNRPLRFMSL